jgi:uncharacterized membrane protein
VYRWGVAKGPLIFVLQPKSLQEFIMSQLNLVSSALAAALALGLGATAVHAEDKAAKEKCYGIAKAGANDCASLSGVHSCAGQAKVDADMSDWKFVAKGSCKGMGGMSADEVKAKMKMGK